MITNFNTLPKYTMYRSISTLTAILMLPLLVIAKGSAKPDPAKYNLSRNGLSFIENKGQVTDQNGKTRTDVDFKLNGDKGLNIFIGAGTLHYQWSKVEAGVDAPPPLGHEHERQELKPPKIDAYRMDVELLNANKKAEIITEEGGNYYENYFLAGLGNGATSAHSWKRITYRNVYPNIDWILYIGNNSASDGLLPGAGNRKETFEYDFVVRLGGNVNDIKLKYGGASELKLNADGSLSAATPMGAVNENGPRSYEKESGIKIPSFFCLNKGVLSFNVDNHEGTIVIDPTLAWCTYFGGSGQDWGEGVACDGSGNVFMNGYTTSSSNIATVGSYLTTYTIGNYTFLAKFDAFGNISWGTYYYGNNTSFSWYGGNRLTCDPSGNVYIIGVVTSTVSGLATSGAYQTTNAGADDAYLVKFSGSGSVLWATYFGGSSNDYGAGVSCDASGNVFMSGWTGSSSGIASSGAYQTSLIGTWNNFLVEFNSSGSIQWATYFGGNCSNSSYEGAGITGRGSARCYSSGHRSYTN